MIGVMQGRLSQSVSGKIQEFPTSAWRSEFSLLSRLGIKVLEWTVDWDEYQSNPIFDPNAQLEISQLCDDYDVEIKSITLDNFVAAPLGFYNRQSGKSSTLDNFAWILDKLSRTSIEILVYPLVKESGIEDFSEIEKFAELFPTLNSLLMRKDLRLALECEFEIEKLELISDLVSKFENIGFNFDTGNSASLGNNPESELKLLGNKIFNVHIKDRLLGGKSVQLGEGAADFRTIFSCLDNLEYKGNYILQAARSKNMSDFEQIKYHLDYCNKFGKGI